MADKLILTACLSVVLSVHVDASRNLALKKPTWQSSTFANDYYVKSDAAVDGNTNPALAAGSCSHTEAVLGVNSWWAVDLGSAVTVQSVKITNRDHKELLPRSSGFTISVSNTAPPAAGGAFSPSARSECASSVNYLAASATVTFPCRDDIKPGRYLYIQSDRSELLTLCEVQVFGA